MSGVVEMCAVSFSKKSVFEGVTFQIELTIDQRTRDLEMELEIVICRHLDSCRDLTFQSSMVRPRESFQCSFCSYDASIQGRVTRRIKRMSGHTI